MRNKADIQKLVDDTLESLEGMQKAEPRPFLFTRVMARMNKEENSAWEKLASLISRPAIAFATVILFLVINAFVIYSVSGNSMQDTQENSVMAGNDYGLSVSSLYDINPEQNDIAQK